MAKRFGIGLLACALVFPLLVACSGGKAITSTLDDATITARVKTALLNDTQVPATQIDVSTSNGVVTMTGVVRSKADEDRAVQLARQVAGVKDVKSNLRVGS